MNQFVYPTDGLKERREGNCKGSSDFKRFQQQMFHRSLCD